MAVCFATASDIATLWRPLTAAEQERAEALLPLISDLIRQRARDMGQNFDQRLADEPDLESVARLVTVDVVSRILRAKLEGDVFAQESQTALGYTWQGTYAIPGGGMANALMNNDLKRLGLLRQQLRTRELWGAGAT